MIIDSNDLLKGLIKIGYSESDYDEIKALIDSLNPADVTNNSVLVEMYSEIATKKYAVSQDCIDVLNIVSKYTGLPPVVNVNPEEITKEINPCAPVNPKYDEYSSIFEDKCEKVYSVKFMEYTNYMNDTVAHNKLPGVYIHTGKRDFLIRSSELAYYSNFGGGYKSIDFVGMITKSTKGSNL